MKFKEDETNYRICKQQYHDIEIMICEVVRCYENKMINQ
jgi:hypothetical protein